jgi:Oxidoreductase molybdopterin binding domain
MNYLRDRLALTTAGLAILTCGTVDTACSAEASAQTGTVVVAGPSLDVNFSAEELARLPLVKVRVSMGTMRGTFSGSFEGPLLWTILENAGAVDPKEPRKQAGEAVLVTGRDGYTAVFGAGEIAPEFEGKQIVLAERVDGKPLEPDHLRIVVPGDRRGGRSVRDVVRIAVAQASSREK